MKKEIKVARFLTEYLPAMNQKIPTTINRGGCGFFALHLAKALTEMNVEFKILAMFGPRNKSGFSKMKRFLAGKISCIGLGVDHVAVEVNGTLYDAIGQSPLITIQDLTLRIEVPIEKLTDLVEHSGDWCETFDRQFKPKIEEYLSDIPKIFLKWKKGDFKYNPQIISEDFKENLNRHTLNGMVRSYGPFILIERDRVIDKIKKGEPLEFETRVG
jgi:hypothetical protein